MVKQFEMQDVVFSKHPLTRAKVYIMESQITYNNYHPYNVSGSSLLFSKTMYHGVKPTQSVPCSFLQPVRRREWTNDGQRTQLKSSIGPTVLGTDTQNDLSYDYCRFMLKSCRYNSCNYSRFVQVVPDELTIRNNMRRKF